MRKNTKIYPSQVEDFLRGKGAITIRSLATYFECRPETIRKKLAILRKEGLPVLPTAEGNILAERVQDEETAKLVLDSSMWLVRCLMGNARIASIAKKPILQARRIKALSPEDRKQLRQTLLMITHAIDMVEIDEELSPHQLKI